jgi:hypothetical protein
MKTTIFVFCLLCATTSAVAQSAPSASQGQPQMLRIAENPLHASEHEMATEQSLLKSSAYSYAQGERPLWEFGSISQPPVPLGDVARAYRTAHAQAKKAEVILEK